ncbi:hypothetical protein ACHAXT_011759 [Thalassiosira profunda]
MEELRLAFLGFGSANRALARMLLDKSELSSDRQRCLRVGARLIPFRVVCIVRRHGRVCVPLTGAHKGECEIDLERALQQIEHRTASWPFGIMLDGSLVMHSARPAERVEDTIADTLTDAEYTTSLIHRLGSTGAANILVEAIPSDPKGDGEPAISYIAQALRSKMQVVSANKSPLAHCKDGKETYWYLQQLARDNGVTYQHESAVMDGVPIFSLWRDTMPHATLMSIRGCLNSTTTMIITRMEGNLDEGTDIDQPIEGESFEEALNAAKQMGIVEADESLDVDGYDAAVKLRALLVVLSTSSSEPISIPTMEEIQRESLRDVTPWATRALYVNGRKKYRLVASAELIDAPSGKTKKWKASVELQTLPPSDPLYNLSGTDSSVTFGTDVLGPVTVVSSNPTLVDTAYGLFSDIVRAAS